MIRRILDTIIPSRRRAARAFLAEQTLRSIQRYVWRAAASARKRFTEDHGRPPTRGDWHSTERACRAWAGTLTLMHNAGFRPYEQIPRAVLDKLNLEFASLFVGESPLPTEAA